MKYLDKINTPKDIKDLNRDELKILCEELREYTINCVSKQEVILPPI